MLIICWHWYKILSKSLSVTFYENQRRRQMKRILNKLFSKLVLGGLIIILQFSWFVYLLYSATVYSSMVDALFKIASIVLALFVSSRDMRSTYKTSWIFLILALPLFGIPAYYLFGRPGLTKRTRMKMDVVSSRIRAYSSPSDGQRMILPDSRRSILPVMRGIRCTGRRIHSIIAAEKRCIRSFWKI